MTTKMNLVGVRFNKLLVLEPTTNHGEFARWICQCDCGKRVVKYTNHLRRGSAKSCGCIRTHHGESRTETYYAWKRMLNRCRDTKRERYGGRGIRVCERWLDYANFKEDMGERPPGMSIDRINNDGDYTPENSRWADSYVQMNNVCWNRKVEAFGKVKTVSEWSREYGLNKATIRGRLEKGWTPEAAVKKPARART